MDTRPRDVSNRVYEYFQPSSEWKEEDEAKFLLLRLPGFKKEYLKAHFPAPGVIQISGERPLKDNKWSRFQQEFQIPENCDRSGIRARLGADVLTVVMPKTITPAQPQQQQQQPQVKPTSDSEAPTAQQPGTGSLPAPDKHQEPAVTLKPMSSEKHPKPIQEMPSRQKSTTEPKPDIRQEAIRADKADDDKRVKENGRPSGDKDDAAQKALEKKEQSDGFGDAAGKISKQVKEANIGGDNEARAKDRSTEKVTAACAGNQLIGLDESRKLIVNMVAAALVVLASVVYLIYTFGHSGKPNK
ncbi:PREDICTED: protein RESTRICTED TEV MOVEMENT 2-like [Nelumbo nucifera]|uniref:Protein RESTRICTED TEV MOVEMENT 2-like n=2 Tax=Nelumbo nucifera TaxID=4432 RepID=A0A1U7Z9L6_NELNU|nr:PREDICTED: protein RESTRICTED TEV MOVEMENT 2-like [Nelumbo nucifera]DAD30399.1 TPA_asm: hypothetical protein HUJ06_009250 [Nelumbo nucifera]